MGTVGVSAFGTLPPEEALKPGNKAVGIASRVALGLAAEVVDFVCGLHLPYVDSLLELGESDQGPHPISVRSKREVYKQGKNSHERLPVTFPFAPRFLLVSLLLPPSQRGRSRLWSR